MDITVGNNSKNTAEKRRRAKKKAIEESESLIMELMNEILQGSNTTGDNKVPKMIEKNTKINDEVQDTDQNKTNAESTENLTEANANGKRSRPENIKKKAKNNEEQGVLLPDLVEISSIKASSELVEEKSGPSDMPIEIEKFDDESNQVDDEIIVYQGKGSINTKEIECLSNDLDQSPRIAPVISSMKRKLLVLDVNGLLACILMPAPKNCRGDIHILGRAVFKRPFCDDFLKFCFQNFDVAIWSSRSKRIIDRVVEYLLGDLRDKLLFCWDMLHSTQTGHRTLENIHKPLVCKELRKIWENEDPSCPWKKGDYDESNTLLLDDSPYKALLNPLHTAIFPNSYHYEDKNDNSLGPGGDLRVYLEGLLASDNVQIYVENHPFGQGAINETNVAWEFYSGVLQTISNQLYDENPSPVPNSS